MPLILGEERHQRKCPRHDFSSQEWHPVDQNQPGARARPDARSPAGVSATGFGP
jgi:hypothetical protein